MRNGTIMVEGVSSEACVRAFEYKIKEFLK